MQQLDCYSLVLTSRTTTPESWRCLHHSSAQEVLW